MLEDRQHYLFISGLPKQDNISGGYHGWNCSELYQDTERQIRVVQGNNPWVALKIDSMKYYKPRWAFCELQVLNSA